MILVVLMVMFAGVSLLAFAGLWIFPRLAARLRLSEGQLAAWCALFFVLCFSTYAGWRVGFAFCHARDVDTQGRCRLGDQCGKYYSHPQWSQMSEKERSTWTGDPGHWKFETCPWCGATGTMSRVAIWKD